MTRTDDALALRTPREGTSSVREIDADIVLLDIEGTISPLSFVRDVLFAYSRERLTGFVADHRGDAVVETLLEQAASQSGNADPVAALVDWQDRDVKAPPLKKLQGLIWEAGFRSGAFQSPIFPDALASLQRWYAERWPLAIYSSGSVQAQLLFFQYSVAGDLRPLFSRHFDTDIGPKIEPSSYTRIADGIGTPPSRIVFFSDAPKELEAAQAAGLQVVHVLKDGIQPAPGFAGISDFSEISLIRK
jgi:enolase-phosphatase E1